MRALRVIEAFFLILIVFGTDDVRRWWMTHVLKLNVREINALDDYKQGETRSPKN